MKKPDAAALAAVDEFLNRAEADMLPKLKGSRFTVAIMDGQRDIKLALEIGASLLFEKPLIILALKDAWIPPRVIELADAVVRVDDLRTPEAVEQFHDALKLVLKKQETV